MDSQYTSIFVGSGIEAQGVSSRLENAGIKAMTKSRGESARLAGFGSALPGETELFVRNSDLDRARAILNDIS